jgi:hypothetical protein
MQRVSLRGWPHLFGVRTCELTSAGETAAAANLREILKLIHVLPPISTCRFAHLCRSRPRGSIRSLPTLTYCYPRNFNLDHSHCLVLAPATLAALPSTRAIETRSLPTSLAATRRGFAFCVASSKSSISSIATCSMSLIPSVPFAYSLFSFSHKIFNDAS